MDPPRLYWHKVGQLRSLQQEYRLLVSIHHIPAYIGRSDSQVVLGDPYLDLRPP